MIGAPLGDFMAGDKLGPCQLRMGRRDIFAMHSRVVYQRAPLSVCKDARFPIKALTDETYLIYFMRFPIYARLFNKQSLNIFRKDERKRKPFLDNR